MSRAVLGAWACLAAAWAQDRPATTCADIEKFLLAARIGPGKETKKGITRPKQVALDDGKLKYTGFAQCIDDRKTRFQSQLSDELNFRDFWGFNVAGYELSKMLELRMVPPYVPRKVGGNSCALSWMIPNVMMDEADRMKKRLEPPDKEAWNNEIFVLRVFNELIYNTDNNLTNVLVTKDWHIWMIDFTRAFRLHKTLQTPQNLVRCDRTLLANLRRLKREELQAKLVKVNPRLLTEDEVDALLARRDKIVEFFDQEVKRKGEAEVLFDLPRVSGVCGAGL